MALKRFADQINRHPTQLSQFDPVSPAHAPRS